MDEGGRIRVAICMGSSCYARGNDQVLIAIRDYLEANSLQDRVSLSGSRCEHQCGSGPNVRIDGVLIQDVDPGSVLDRLKSILEPKS
jgi:NADH:ubiquinone oxidoreductase 24 kD subunit